MDEYEKKKQSGAPEPGFDMLQLIEADLDAASHCLERLKEAAKRDLKVE